MTMSTAATMVGIAEANGFNLQGASSIPRAEGVCTKANACAPHLLQHTGRALVLDRSTRRSRPQWTTPTWA